MGMFKKLKDDDVVVCSNFDLEAYKFVKFLIGEEIRKRIFFGAGHDYIKELMEYRRRIETFKYVKHLFDSENKNYDWNINLFIEDVKFRIAGIRLNFGDEKLIEMLNFFVGQLEGYKYAN